MTVIREYFKQLLTWGPVVIAFNGIVGSVAVVEGRSMQPTLNPVESNQTRDRVILDKASVQVFHRYKRGQLVVLTAPDDKSTSIIKRLIAIEGDWLRDRNGHYIHIPRGKCWVEGDNAAFSEDSESLYGPIPLALIQARVIGVVWPPSRIQSITEYVPPNRVNCW